MFLFNATSIYLKKNDLVAMAISSAYMYFSGAVEGMSAVQTLNKTGNKSDSFLQDFLLAHLTIFTRNLRFVRTFFQRN